MKIKYANCKQPMLAASVAPEDLNVGDFVAVLSEIVEFPSFIWNDTSLCDRTETVRVRFCRDSMNTTFKVLAVCLPFVFVQAPSESTKTIDVRHVQLARLTNQYAQTIWSARKNRRKARRKKRKKK